MFFQLTFEDVETKHCHICFLQRPGYKLYCFKSSKMVCRYFSRISQRLKKKREINATKQSWEIDILYSLVSKMKFDLILHVGPIPKHYY